MRQYFLNNVVIYNASNNPYRYTDPDGRKGLEINIPNEVKVLPQSLGFSSANKANTKGPAAITAAKHQIAEASGDISDVTIARAIVPAVSFL